MKIKVKNNKAVIFLLLITFAVWGAILFNVIKYYKSRDGGSEEISEAASSFDEARFKTKSGNAGRMESGDAEMQYKSLDYDPFRMNEERSSENKSPVKKSVQMEEKLTPVKPRMNYKVSGVIINKGNKLVIFEDVTEGKILFLREGDTYKDVTIETVLMDKVTLREDGLAKLIMLQK